MPYYEFWWTDWNLEKLATNDVSPEDFEHVVCNPIRLEPSRTSGEPIAFGTSSDGRMIACVYEPIDELIVRPITAFYTERR